MAAYLKTEMPFYGVQKRGRTEVIRELKKRFPLTDMATYRAAVEALWRQPHREEKYLAISIARQYSAFVTFENLDLYRRMIVEGAWWDFVDDVAINCVGIVYLNDTDLGPGAVVDVRCTDGALHKAELCTLPMYDPEGKIVRGKDRCIPQNPVPWKGIAARCHTSI